MFSLSFLRTPASRKPRIPAYWTWVVSRDGVTVDSGREHTKLEAQRAAKSVVDLLTVVGGAA